MLEKLKYDINLYFQSCYLDDEYSLLECDFFDVYYRHISDVTDEHLEAIGVKRDNFLDLSDIEYYGEFYKIMETAFQNNARTVEERHDWHNISRSYLVYFSMNCCYLSTKAFFFYLPQAMILDLENIDSEAFFDYFFFRLDRKQPEDLLFLNENQLDVIGRFLRCSQKIKP